MPFKPPGPVTSARGVAALFAGWLALLGLVIWLGSCALVIAGGALVAGAATWRHRRRPAAPPAVAEPAGSLKAGPMAPWASALIDQELARLRDQAEHRGPRYEAFAALMRDAGAGDLEDKDVHE